MATRTILHSSIAALLALAAAIQGSPPAMSATRIHGSFETPLLRDAGPAIRRIAAHAVHQALVLRAYPIAIAWSHAGAARGLIFVTKTARHHATNEPCAQLRHRVEIGGTADEATTIACRNADHDWLVIEHVAAPAPPAASQPLPDAHQAPDEHQVLPLDANGAIIALEYDDAALLPFFARDWPFARIRDADQDKETGKPP